MPRPARQPTGRLLVAIAVAAAIASLGAPASAAENRWLDAALALGPHDAADRAALGSDYRALVERLGRATTGSGPLDRAREIHSRLHGELLRTYAANAYDIGRQLHDGTYNCATATLVFLAVADQGRVDAWAGQWVGHVAPVVMADGQRWVVEIALPTWTCWSLDRGAAADRCDDIAAVRRLGPRELAAVLWFNRGVATAEDRQFAAAVAAYGEALRLDADCRPAAANRLATLNNWAVELVRTGRPQAALALLGQGLQWAPDYGPFLHNRASLLARPAAPTATVGPAGNRGAAVDESRFVNY